MNALAKGLTALAMTRVPARGGDKFTGPVLALVTLRAFPGPAPT